MVKDESVVQQEIRIESPKYKCILMRNNVGVLLNQDGRPVRYGLMNESKEQNKNIKSSDLIGFTQVFITPDMVGKTLAVFTAIEVKKPEWDENKKFDKHEQAQFNFINWIKNNGGIAFFCNCADKLKELLKV